MSRKAIYRGIMITVVITLLLGLLAQFMAKEIITDYLDRNIPDNVQLRYDRLRVNILTGSVVLERLGAEWSDPDTTAVQGALRMEELNLEGLGYLALLFDNSLNFDHVGLVRPKIIYAPYRRSSEKDTVKTGLSFLNRALTISRFHIVGGAFTQLQEGRDTIRLEVENIDMSVMDLKTNGELLKNRIPFTFGDYSLATGKVRVDLGPFEKLEFNKVHISGGNMLVNGLSLTSKYPKTELSRLLEYERDHVDLKIPEISLLGFELGSVGNRFSVRSESGTLESPELEIYRDKLVPDNPNRKKMYGQLLRELKFDLDIEKFNIVNGRMVYTELVTKDIAPGEILFTEIHAKINALSNVRERGPNIGINAKLMGHAPLLLNWEVGRGDGNDAFFVSGNVSDFKAESINPFLKSNLRTEAKGEIGALYFTISGDAVSSRGDMKMKYGDFGFQVLQKNRVGINRLLTAIGNLFVNDGSKADDQGYRYGDIYAERDPTKSFFNYLWLNVRAGLLDTFTGDGKE